MFLNILNSGYEKILGESRFKLKKFLLSNYFFHEPDEKLVWDGRRIQPEEEINYAFNYRFLITRNIVFLTLDNANHSHILEQLYDFWQAHTSFEKMEILSVKMTCDFSLKW